MCQHLINYFVTSPSWLSSSQSCQSSQSSEFIKEQKLQILLLGHPPLHNYTVCSVTRTTGRRVFSDYIVYPFTHCLSTVVLSLNFSCDHSHRFSLTSIHNDLRRRSLPPCHLPWLLRHDDDCPIPLPRCQFQRRGTWVCRISKPDQGGGYCASGVHRQGVDFREGELNPIYNAWEEKEIQESNREPRYQCLHHLILLLPASQAQANCTLQSNQLERKGNHCQSHGFIHQCSSSNWKLCNSWRIHRIDLIDKPESLEVSSRCKISWALPAIARWHIMIC